MKGTNMGKGDKRTKKGKICRGTFGKARPKAIKTIPPKKTADTPPSEG